MPDPIPDDDLYQRLGVPPNADASTIDRAWRALQKLHHPDVAGAESWARSGLADRPWPADVPETEYAALRVSAALARRDAADAARLDSVPESDREPLREAFARTAHVVALRPIFPARDFARLRAPWAAIAEVAREPRATATVRRA